MNRYQLWRYVAEMKAGDWVLVPKYGTFSVYELTDDAPISVVDFGDTIVGWNGVEYKRNSDGLIINEDGKIIDLGFLRKVKPIAEDIPRSQYCTNILFKRLKIRQTNVNVSAIADSIKCAVDNFKKNKPINFRRDLDDVIPNICKSLQQTLNSDKFECLVKWYFERIGASYVEIPSKNPVDKQGYEDIDVEATFDILKTTYYIQVKHHEGKTAEWAAKQVAEKKRIHEKTDMADGYSRIYWALTSAENFTEECKKIAQENNIQLVTGPEFASMLLDAGLANVNEAFEI